MDDIGTQFCSGRVNHKRNLGKQTLMLLSAHKVSLGRSLEACSTSPDTIRLQPTPKVCCRALVKLLEEFKALPNI